MKRPKPMEIRQALSEGRALPWALITTYGGVTLGPVPAHFQEEEVIEARFFSPDREIHIWREGEALCAAILTGAEGTDRAEGTAPAGGDGGAAADGDADAVTRKYRLANDQLGEWIAVTQYLDYDEDGQAYVTAVRLSGWEGGKTHG